MARSMSEGPDTLQAQTAPGGKAAPSAEAAPSGTQDGSGLSFPLAFGALVLGAMAMGISPVFVREADVGPFSSAFWRVALALPVLLLWGWLEARRNGRGIPSLLRFSRPVLLVGLTFAGDLFFWHLAILNTSIANATLLACLAPVWVLLLSGWLLGERVPRSAWMGLALCLSGAAVLIGLNLRVDPNRAWGDAFGLMTSVFFGLYFLAVPRARRDDPAGVLTFKGTLVTAAILFVVALSLEDRLWPQTVEGALSLLALGLLSHTGGQGLLAVALGSLSAVFSSLVIFIEAVAAAVFGWVFAGEKLTLYQILGGALILVGIWIARPREP